MYWERESAPGPAEKLSAPQTNVFVIRPAELLSAPPVRLHDRPAALSAAPANDSPTE